MARPEQKTVKIFTMSTKNITGDHDLRAPVERGQDGPRTVVRVHGVDGGAGELLACQ